MPPTRSAVLARLRTLLAEHLALDDDGTRFEEPVGLLGQGIGLDSVEVLQLVAAIEEAFGITVDDADLLPEHFATVGSLASFVQERVT